MLGGINIVAAANEALGGRHRRLWCAAASANETGVARRWAALSK